ncbi:hypothetical protein CsSME_00015844 [Camellia sinensis var. sinensis]
MSQDNHVKEENLFYTLPLGSMEAYKKSIESHLAQVEKTGSSIQEEVETSMYDAAADNAYEEDERETRTYYFPGAFEGSKPSKFSQKNRKNSTNSHTQSVLMGKRPANNLNVGMIPTKRIRTASRQRILSPFSAATSGGVYGPNRTGASSVLCVVDPRSQMVWKLSQWVTSKSNYHLTPQKYQNLKRKRSQSIWVPHMSRDGSLITIFKLNRGIIQKRDWTVINLNLMEAVVYLVNTL